MKKNKFYFLFLVMVYYLIFTFLLYNSFSYLDPDLGWHLKVGEQIWLEKTVPHFEYHDYTLEGKTWVDHEWLLNLISFLIYNKFGYITLNLLFAFVVLITLIILNIFTKKYFIKNKNAFLFILFFQAFGVIAMSPHLGVRMQEITVLNLTILLVILYTYNQNKKISTILWLVPLFYFWVCAHAGFLIGIFLLFLWLITNIIKTALKKYYTKFYYLNLSNTLNSKELSKAFLIIILTIISTTLTPYGLKLYSFLSEYASNTYYLTHIKEWLPIYYFSLNYYQIFYLATALSFFILYLYLAFTQKQSNKIDLWDFCLFILFFVLAIKSRRHFPLFFVASFPFIINFLTDYFSCLKINLSNLSRLIQIYLILTLFFASSLFVVKTNFTNNPFTNHKFCQRYPCAAIKFLKNNPQYSKLKIFNEYGWGGFMIWTWPEKKLFIDGRLPQYKFAEHTMLEEYYEFFKEEKAADKLEQYNIQLVLLRKPQPIQADWLERFIFSFNENELKNPANYLINYLKNSPNWQLVYDDKISYIYAKQ